MKKILPYALFLFAITLTSCSGCSKSGKRPTGPKTFVKGFVLSTKQINGYGTKFLIDLNFDGRADSEELIRNPMLAPRAKDTVTLVMQQGQIVEWYK